MQNAIETMKSLTFGTELEYTGITRPVAAKAIQSVIGGTIAHRPDLGYDTWQIKSPDGRIWKKKRRTGSGQDIWTRLMGRCIPLDSD